MTTTNNTTTRTCTRCNNVFPVTAFRVRTDGRTVFWCNPCFTAYSRERRARIATGAVTPRTGRTASRTLVSAADLTYGVELEYGNITTGAAAAVIASVVGGVAGSYCQRENGHTANGHAVVASDGRRWICEYDSSISGFEFGTAEIVSPVLKGAADMELLQKIVRALRAAGAQVNHSTGLHVHVGVSSWKVARSTVAHFAAVQDAAYEACQVISARTQWAAKLPAWKVSELTACSTDASLRRAWYGCSQTVANAKAQKYHGSRYRGINLCSFWRQGTVEFRLFNSTTHAGKVRAAVQFALALVAAAHNAVDVFPVTADRAGMAACLDSLGLQGDGAATVRHHFLARWDADDAADDAAHRAA